MRERGGGGERERRVRGEGAERGWQAVAGGRGQERGGSGRGAGAALGGGAAAERGESVEDVVAAFEERGAEGGLEGGVVGVGEGEERSEVLGLRDVPAAGACTEAGQGHSMGRGGGTAEVTG